jgi:hypothetical protein
MAKNNFSIPKPWWTIHRGFLLPQKESEGMSDQIKFNYDWQLECLEDCVGKAFLWYCQMKKIYPKVIIIGMVNAGFQSPLLEVRLDRSLQAGVFMLGVK